MVQRSPSNKMVGASDENTKGVKPFRTQSEDDNQPQRFFYPRYGVSVEAKTQEEADSKIKEVAKQIKNNGFVE